MVDGAIASPKVQGGVEVSNIIRCEAPGKIVKVDQVDAFFAKQQIPGSEVGMLGHDVWRVRRHPEPIAHIGAYPS
jgi:hypothetical protein